MKKLFLMLSLILMSTIILAQYEDQLNMKSTSAAGDTIRVVKDGESALMLRSTLLSEIEDTTDAHLTRIEAIEATSDVVLDSIAAHRTDINTNTSTGVTNAGNISANSVYIGVNESDISDLEDSIYTHRTELNNHTDSIADHRIDMNANLDSITIINSELNDIDDTLAVHLDTLQGHNTRLLLLEGGSAPGTVTSVSAGNGMDFTPITGAGPVTMGAPSTLTVSTTNALTTTSHTHELDLSGIDSSWTSITVDTINSTHLLFDASSVTLNSDVYFDAATYDFGGLTNKPSTIYTNNLNVDGTILTSNVITTANADPISIEPGSSISGGTGIAGSLYLQRGLAATGTPGSIYFGSGSTGHLDNDDTETNLVAYDSSTGKATYRTVASLPSGGTSDSAWISITVDTVKFNDTNTEIWEDGSSDMHLKDANAGTVTLSELDDIPIYQTITTQTSSTYTLDIDDVQTFIISDVDGGSSVTVPPNSSVAFPLGTRIRISKIGITGNCNVYEGSGVTVNHWEGAPAVRNFGTGELIKIDTDEWMLSGDIINDS